MVLTRATLGQTTPSDAVVAPTAVPVRRQFIPISGAICHFGGPLTLTEIRTQLHARVLEGITLLHWGVPLHTMLVADQGNGTGGRKKGRVNKRATELYLANCKPGTKRQIRGDVVIVPDQDFTYDLPLE